MFLFREFTLIEKREFRASLKHIYGLGWLKSNKISDLLGLSNPYFSNNFNDYYINLTLYLLKRLIISDNRIKRLVETHINNLLINNSYRGTRHKLSLPARGQRTRTNSATQRKKRTLSLIK